MIKNLLFEKYNRRVYIDRRKVYVDDIEIASIDKRLNHLYSRHFQDSIKEWHSSIYEAIIACYQLADDVLFHNYISLYGLK